MSYNDISSDSKYTPNRYIPSGFFSPESPEFDASRRREMPNSQDAEHAILGLCLTNRDSLNWALNELRPTDFYNEFYAHIFEILKDMASQNILVDAITFLDELKKREFLESTRIEEFVKEIVNYGNNDSNLYLKEYINRVIENAKLREIIKTGEYMMRLGYKSGEQESHEIIAEATQRILDLSVSRTISQFYPLSKAVSDGLDELNEKIKQSREGSVGGFATGYRDLDNILEGLYSPNLVILGARPAMGKTALALNIATFGKKCGEEVPIIFVSLEMGKNELGQRIVAATSEVDLSLIQNGIATEEQRNKFFAAGKIYVKKVRSKDFYIIDESAGLPISELRIKCQQFQIKTKKKIGLIIVDYLQLLSSKVGYGNKTQEIADVSKGLKALARDLECPVLALSQLSRDPEKRIERKPKLSDLRDSGAIEQDADIVMLLDRPDYEDSTEDEDLANLIIAKHRSGRTGEVQLTFRRNITRFYDRVLPINVNFDSSQYSYNQDDGYSSIPI